MNVGKDQLQNGRFNKQSSAVWEAEDDSDGVDSMARRDHKGDKKLEEPVSF